MKQLITITLNSICLLLFIGSTASAEHSRPYFSLVGGLNLADEIVLSDQEGDYVASLDKGFFAGGALGYDLGDGFPQLGKGRIELEAGHRYNVLKDAQFSTGTLNAEGDVTAISLMLNCVGEYEDYSPYYVPYIGVGIGAALISMNETSVEGSPMIDDDSTAFAYQILTGLSFPLFKNLDFDLGYRYFGAVDPEFTDSKNQKVNADYAYHNFEIGLRLGF